MPLAGSPDHTAPKRKEEESRLEAVDRDNRKREFLTGEENYQPYGSASAAGAAEADPTHRKAVHGDQVPPQGPLTHRDVLERPLETSGT